MKTLYVVMASKGEYSDRHEWTVAAHTTRVNAELHLMCCERWHRENGDAWNDVWDEGKRQPNPYDPDYSTDYVGTHYWIDEIDLYDGAVAAQWMVRAGI